jgi:Lon protease-like protein
MAELPGDGPIFEDQSQLPDPLPIFPLPNVVLMPNASLPLYIFEERYKEMVRDCLAGEPYLSVALLRKGWEQQAGTPRPYPIAGFGRITRAVRRPNDCMDIAVQGMGRIEMLEFNEDRAYLRASVRTLSPAPMDEALATSQAHTMRQRFLDLVDRKGVAADPIRTQLKLLASPIDMVFFVASHLPLDPHSQQELLQTLSVEEQIARLTNVLNLMRGAQLN